MPIVCQQVDWSDGGDGIVARADGSVEFWAPGENESNPLAREHQLMIFSDEIYDRLVMDGLQHVSIASMAPDLFCVTFSGLSKSHMISGYRIGWMVLSGN